jgi:hypothetical protein
VLAARDRPQDWFGVPVHAIFDSDMERWRACVRAAEQLTGEAGQGAQLARLLAQLLRGRR